MAAPEGFKHKYSVTIRFNEVDMLGVCNNAVYLNFMEDARLQYMKNLKLMPKDGSFSDGSLYFIVHNEIDYQSHSFYDETIDVYTRVAYIKKSSFGFEHVMLKAADGSPVASGKGVIVRVDPETRKSMQLETAFTETIKAYDTAVKLVTEE